MRQGESWSRIAHSTAAGAAIRVFVALRCYPIAGAAHNRLRIPPFVGGNKDKTIVIAIIAK
jgi:hypothetical protein